jgi:hypothetical protein
MDGKLTPTQKGAIAETAIAARATKLGIHVYRPVAEGARCDLVFAVEGRFWGIQCKWGALRGDVIVAGLRTSRLTSNGYVRTIYTADEIDAFAIYCGELGKCYLIPVADVPEQSYLHLRLRPALNNQQRGLKWAAHYELGAIAQLGERGAGSAEVVGSSPTSST